MVELDDILSMASRRAQATFKVKVSPPPGGSKDIGNDGTNDKGPSGSASGTQCAVLGCNAQRDLRLCNVHKRQLRSKCGCRTHFTTFPFPNSEKLRKTWLLRIGRPNLQVDDSTFVCSKHFVEGRPTSRSFFPTLYLQPDDEDELIDGEEDEESDFDNGDINDNEPLMPVISDTYTIEQGTADDQIDYCSQKGENGDTGDKSNEEVEEDEDDDLEVVYQSSPPHQPEAKVLAQYDPSAQTLQITDPVKYIMQCHNRIADLLAENQKMKAENTVLKQKLARLEKLHANPGRSRQSIHGAQGQKSRLPFTFRFKK